MAYTTLADVEARLPSIGGESAFAPLTTAQVEGIRDDIELELESIVAGAGLSVPVTTPAQAVGAVKNCATWGIAAEVQRARFRGGSGINSEESWTFFEGRYKTCCKTLPVRLEAMIGAPLDTLGSGGSPQFLVDKVW